jgi:hypothetical protein
VTKGSVEQSLRQQVKDEIGDVEDMPFKQKNMLNQKFGITPAYVTLDEIAYWEMREEEEYYVRQLWNR